MKKKTQEHPFLDKKKIQEGKFLKNKKFFKYS